MATVQNTGRTQPGRPLSTWRSSEVALRVHDPRIGTRRPVRVEPDWEPDAQLVCQQRDGDEVDGDHGEKREEHLADEPHEGISI